MPALRTILPMVLLLACPGCLKDVRPTVVGRVLDADTGGPLPDVGVSIHSVTSCEHPEPLARTTTDADGNFVCPGAHPLDIWWGYCKLYRLRFHRNGYADAVCDFTYQVDGGLSADRKQIGPIGMQGGAAHPRAVTTTAASTHMCH